jgi:hypothetical protein
VSDAEEAPMDLDETSPRERATLDDDLLLDGNAAGGILAEVFAADMTGAPGECAHCGTVSVVATLRAYTRGPGVVLRCPTCGGVVLRVVRTPTVTLLDVSGARWIRIARS